MENMSYNIGFSYNFHSLDLYGKCIKINPLVFSTHTILESWTEVGTIHLVICHLKYFGHNLIRNHQNLSSGNRKENTNFPHGHHEDERRDRAIEDKDAFLNELFKPNALLAILASFGSWLIVCCDIARTESRRVGPSKRH
jgi:hypothetical protein